jgi:hypothetical protein
VIKWNNRAKGSVKGEPRKFIHGHNMYGANHHSWREGRIENHCGYMAVSSPLHPRVNNRNYVPEHIIVAERVFGKLLPPKAVIHHINERKDDNHPGNLVICENNAYHHVLHRRMRAMQESGHADWRKCPYCKTYDSPEKMTKKVSKVTSFSQHLHKSCFNKYRREQYAIKKEMEEINYGCK